MRVLLLGDTHGNAYWFKQACRKAQFLGCEVILQLGDFGYWEHIDDDDFLGKCSKYLEKYERYCVWLDGNHENHPLLWEKYGPPDIKYATTQEIASSTLEELNSGLNYDPGQPKDWWKIREHLYYLPRGARWTWPGKDDNTVRFLACGGAHSIDKAGRTPGHSWWPEELITDEQMQKCIDGGDVDVVVSHDAPVMANGVFPPYSSKIDCRETHNNRIRLQEIVNHVHPRLVVHGHYHHRNSTRMGVNHVRVEGFACDNMPRSMGVLDLRTLEVTNA